MSPWWTTLAGGIAGLGVWAALWRARAAGRLDGGRLALAVFGVGLICRVTLMLGTPVFHAPDERGHLNYVAHIAEHRSLPVQEQLVKVDNAKGNWSFIHPPLYHVLMNLPYAAAGAAGIDDVGGRVRVMRACSILLWCASFGGAVLWLRRFPLRDPALAGAVLAFMGLLPTHVFISSVMNNDNLLILLGVLILLVLLRPPSPATMALAGALTGLGMWTKYNAGVYGIAVGAWLAALLLSRRLPLWRAVREGLCFGLSAAAVWAPLALRNIRLYGSPTGESFYYEHLVEHWTFPEVVSYMVKTFWATCGVYNQIILVPRVLGVLATAALAGALVAALLRRGAGRELLAARDFQMAGFLAAAAVLVGVFVRMGMQYGACQGRYLFVLIVPLAVFLGLAARTLLPVLRGPDADVHIAGFFAAYALAFVGYSEVFRA
jgi:hypothetical protein